jgi:myo-inositol-1-phosphate synthase
MILALRGGAGGVGSTITVGTLLAKLGPIEEHGSVLTEKKWREVGCPDLAQIDVYSWDIVSGSAYEAALRSAIFKPSDLIPVAADLAGIKMHPAPVCIGESINANGNLQRCARTDVLEYYRAELKRLKNEAEVVAGNVASTSTFNKKILEIASVKELWSLMRSEHRCINSGVLFALAACLERVPFFDFTPDLTLESPAVIECARQNRAAVAGKDGNTGQSFLKTVLAEMFVTRNIRIQGWYSTNVLGNEDGRRLMDRGARKSKMRDKLGVTASIVPYPFSHVVDISFEEAHGDWKEAWDSVLATGWLGTSIRLQVNWQASDSLLAAPVATDVARLLALDARRRRYGIRRKLAPFFKRPIGGVRKSLLQEYAALANYYCK